MPLWETFFDSSVPFCVFLEEYSSYGIIIVYTYSCFPTEKPVTFFPVKPVTILIVDLGILVIETFYISFSLFYVQTLFELFRLTFERNIFFIVNC